MMIYTGTTISFQANGKFHQAHNSHPSFSRIVELAKAGDLSEAARLIDLKQVVQDSLKGSRAELRGNSVYFDNEEVRGTLASRIIQMAKEGFDASPLLLFLENLMNNPSKRAVDELYGFLESSQLPITDDGHFLAYKAVRQDYTDIHSGTFDNSVGSICEMPRNRVDEDKDRTCSKGLHFAAHEYASSFGGRNSKMMVLKINPRDVVAIPSDYNNQKGRCCRYEVIEEVERSDTKLTGAGFVDTGSTKAGTSVTFDEPKYVPQMDNYDDPSVWCLGTFCGDAKEFPVNRDVPYELCRLYDDKTYKQAFFTRYDEKNDNLVFKYMKAGEVAYCTISDVDDWDIEVY